MAEKLTELSWTAFAKTELSKDQRKLLDDGALQKALIALDKTGHNTPAEQQTVLNDLVEQLKKQVAALAKRKKELGDDKLFGKVKDKLYGLLELAETQHKAAQRDVAEAKRTGSEDDDDDSPAVLTTRMVPLIRQIKKGDLRLPAMIGSISKTAAVLISKRSISNTKRKLLNEALDAAGGVKYAKGECYYETGTLHFVMSEGKVGGLAKRVRAALLNQTGLRLKVKLRGEDGEDTDGEEEAEDAAGTPVAPGAQAAETGGGAGTTTARPAPPGGPASAEQLAFTQRLRKVREAYDAALKAQHPESTKLRALMGFASEKAAAKDFAGASKALDLLHKMLGTSAGTGAATESPRTPDSHQGDPRLAFNARLTALMPRIKDAIAGGGASASDIKLKASEAGVLARQKDFEQAHRLLDEVENRLSAAADRHGSADSTSTAAPAGVEIDLQSVWQQAKDTVDTQLSALQDALRKTRVVALLEIANQIDRATLPFRTSLSIALANLRQATPSQRETARTRALSVVDQYKAILASDPAVSGADRNPFGLTVEVRRTLGDALSRIESQLN